MRRGNNGFHPPGQFSPGEQNAMMTAVALQANICSETGDRPFVTPAGMGLAQFDNGVNLQVGEHIFLMDKGLNIKDYTVTRIGLSCIEV